MKRGGELKRTSMRRRPLKKKGETDQQAVWRIVRQEVLERDQYSCQASELVGDACFGSLHVHHLLPRGRGGEDVLSNLKSVCLWHHQWIHDHPADSYRLGLLRRTEAA